MKKFFTILIVVMLVVSLTACMSTIEIGPTVGTTIPEPAETTIDNTAPEETQKEITLVSTAPEETEETIHEHTYTQNTVDTSCVEDGYTIHICACGDSYKDKYVEAHGHQWSEWKTTKAATESSEGAAERVCSVCGTKETKTIPRDLSNHTHKYSEMITKTATCASEGVKTFTCSCGDQYTESVEKTTHNYTKTVVAPTCKAEGYTLVACSGCGNSYREDHTNAIGHQYVSTVISKARCYATGKQKNTCTVCGYSYNEDIPKIEHPYNVVVTDPTCTEKGRTTYTCNDCGYRYHDHYVDALGHEDGELVVLREVNCIMDAYVCRKCTRCSALYQVEGEKAYGHSYVMKWDTATCTQDGEIIEACENCTSERRTPSPAKGHGETEVNIQKGNCVTDGYEYVVCTVCRQTLSTTVIPAIGAHTYETTNLANAAVRYWEESGDGYYMPYCNYYDWRVEACKTCGDIDDDSIRFAYSDYEAALIMLGYVNELRESVYGTDAYNLELAPELLDLAKVRAQEIEENFCHVGLPFGENICSGRPDIYSHFMQWYNSPGHYQNMIYQEYNTFCYAIHTGEPIYGQQFQGIGYGVQLFGY